MSRKISLFSDYHGKENLSTNHCGLILKLLYQDNPEAFSELLSEICSEPINIGLQFAQQQRQKLSVPDLTIKQDGTEILFEFKTTDWFYSDQLKRHLNGYNKGGSHRKILFAVSNFEGDDYQEDFKLKQKEAHEEAKLQEVILVPLSFEDLLNELQNLKATSPDFKEYLTEFAEYLDRQGLLPTWKYLLDVVNCSSTKEELERTGAYICCNRDGAYTHRRARYMGAYTGNKTVTQVAEVLGLVSCTSRGENYKIEWPIDSTQASQDELIKRAQECLPHLHEWHKKDLDDCGLKFFIFSKDNIFPTHFIKHTSGGLRGSKKYFWNIAKPPEVNNAKELAKKLDGKKWEDFL